LQVEFSYGRASGRRKFDEGVSEVEKDGKRGEVNEVP